MRVELPSGTPAEVARPETYPARGLVVIPDIMGLRPLFDDLTARLAGEHDWAVAAVEPFPHQELSSLEDRFRAIPAGGDGRLLADIAGAADVLATDRVAVLGFCMGGMYALKAAASGRFDRAVSFYGMIRLPADWKSAGQREPLELLDAGSPCPILAIIGGRDPYTPPDDVAALQRRAGVEVAIYPEAEHGFVHDAARPAHRSADAADAWAKTLAFLG